jgi:hypothetical protein
VTLNRALIRYIPPHEPYRVKRAQEHYFIPDKNQQEYDQCWEKDLLSKAATFDHTKRITTRNSVTLETIDNTVYPVFSSKVHARVAPTKRPTERCCFLHSSTSAAARKFSPRLPYRVVVPHPFEKTSIYYLSHCFPLFSKNHKTPEDTRIEEATFTQM